MHLKRICWGSKKSFPQEFKQPHFQERLLWKQSLVEGSQKIFLSTAKQRATWESICKHVRRHSHTRKHTYMVSLCEFFCELDWAIKAPYLLNLQTQSTKIKMWNGWLKSPKAYFIIFQNKPYLTPSTKRGGGRDQNFHLCPEGWHGITASYTFQSLQIFKRRKQLLVVKEFSSGGGIK